MPSDSIQLQCESPDLLIEFDLPPGTHATIGASPRAEITLPLGGIPPLSCTLGRFHDGRLYLAGLDGLLSYRVDPPAVLTIPPYDFLIVQPADLEDAAAEPQPEALSGGRSRSFTTAGKSILSSLFRKRGNKVVAPPQEPEPAEEEHPPKP